MFTTELFVYIIIVILCGLYTCFSVPIYTFIDIGDGELGLINVNTNQIIQIDVKSIPNWPYDDVADMQHSLILSDNSIVYVTTTAQDPLKHPKAGASVVAFEIESIDWDQSIASLNTIQVYELEPAGTQSSYPNIQQIVSSQPIPDWTQPLYTQIHGLTLRPNTPYLYGTTWTDSTIFAIDISNNDNAMMRYTFDGYSDHSHGLFFNSNGDKAISSSYYFDETSVTLYTFNNNNNSTPIVDSKIELNVDNDINKNIKGAFTHYVYWYDDRYAFTATMQFNITSLTDTNNYNIVSPGIWLIDTVEKQANQVVGTAYNVDDSGILRSASDITIANGKLYIAEEDSLDNEFGNDGFISIFDISNSTSNGGSIFEPIFIKRLKPSNENGQLPIDYAVSHGLVATPKQDYVFVGAYASHYIIKIDTITDKVVYVFSQKIHNLSFPHGGWISVGDEEDIEEYETDMKPITHWIWMIVGMGFLIGAVGIIMLYWQYQVGYRKVDFDGNDEENQDVPANIIEEEESVITHTTH